MSVAEDTNLEDRTVQYPKLRLLQGGKGPPEPPRQEDNWLNKFSVGTVFCCRQSDKTVDWEEYYLVSKIDEDLYLLKVSVPDGKVWERRVDPRLFCNHHKDYKVLWIIKQEEHEDASTEQRDPLQPG